MYQTVNAESKDISPLFTLRPLLGDQLQDALNNVESPQPGGKKYSFLNSVLFVCLGRFLNWAVFEC